MVALTKLIQRPLDIAEDGRGQILLHGFIKDGIINQDAEDPLSLGPFFPVRETMLYYVIKFSTQVLSISYLASRLPSWIKWAAAGRILSVTSLAPLNVLAGPILTTMAASNLAASALMVAFLCLSLNITNARRNDETTCPSNYHNWPH